MSSSQTSSVLSSVKAIDQANKIDFSPTEVPEPTTGGNFLITGGASGIGAALTKYFAECGAAHIVIADSNVEAGIELEKHLSASYEGSKIKFIETDVRSWDSQCFMLRTALVFLGTLGNLDGRRGRAFDVVVTSAGIAGAKWNFLPVDPELDPYFADTPTKNEKDASMSAASTTKNLLLGEPVPSFPVAPDTAAMDVNVVGTYYTVNLMLKYGMSLHLDEVSPGETPKEKTSPNGGTTNPYTSKKATTKLILLMGSMASYGPLPQSPLYTCTKFGIRGLFHSLRLDLPTLGCRVNMLAPFYVDTNMTKHAIPMLEKMGVKLASMDDVIKAAQRLVWDEDATGRAIGVTGAGCVDLGDDVGGALAGFQQLMEAGVVGSVEASSGGLERGKESLDE